MDAPMIRSILVPVDFSEITERVMAHALMLAGQNRARLTLLHVVNVPPLVEAGPWGQPASSLNVEYELRKQLRAAAEEKLRALQEECGRLEVKAETSVCEGTPYDEIIRTAEEIKADLIVMGSQGHSALSRFLVGSNAERVVRRARQTVLCVKPAGQGEG